MKLGFAALRFHGGRMLHSMNSPLHCSKHGAFSFNQCEWTCQSDILVPRSERRLLHEPTDNLMPIHRSDTLRARARWRPRDDDSLLDSAEGRTKARTGQRAEPRLCTGVNSQAGCEPLIHDIQHGCWGSTGMK